MSQILIQGLSGLNSSSPANGKQVMNLEDKNGGGTDNKDGVSIITMGEMICYLLKALGAWFDDEGKLALHPVEADIRFRGV